LGAFLEDKEVHGVLFSVDDRHRRSGFFQDSEEFKFD